jgi:hypothetical protein
MQVITQLGMEFDLQCEQPGELLLELLELARSVERPRDGNAPTEDRSPFPYISRSLLGTTPPHAGTCRTVKTYQ